jgi:hypothetical protein
MSPRKCEGSFMVFPIRKTSSQRQMGDFVVKEESLAATVTSRYKRKQWPKAGAWR